MAWPVNARTSAMLDELQALCGFPITVTQGSPSTSDPTSAGTHAGEGVFDAVGADLDVMAANARKVGFAAWHRTRAEGFTPHVHGVAVGEPDLSPQAAAQVDDYFAGRNGLATHAPDDGPRAYVGVTWETYDGTITDGEAARVYRGEQMPPTTTLLNGSFDSTSNYAVTYRDDGTTFTLNAGDVLCVFVRSFDTQDGDVWSLANWRMNAAGHGAVTLSEGFHVGYTATIPSVLTNLGTLTLDRDTLALTATRSQFTSADADRIANDGYAVLRIECTTGSISIDWVCLQVDVPGGMLAPAGGSWSEWIIPDEYNGVRPETASGVLDTGLIEGRSYGLGWDETDAEIGVQAALADASSQWGPLDSWAADTDESVGAAAWYARVRAYATRYIPDLGDPNDSVAVVQTDPYIGVFRWQQYPDYRQTPEGLVALLFSGEAVDNPDIGNYYEWQPGVDSVTSGWGPTTAVGHYNYVDLSDPIWADGATASLMFYQEAPATWVDGVPVRTPAIPMGTPFATWAEDYATVVEPAPTFLPDQDLYVWMESSYITSGTNISPPGYWDGGPLITPRERTPMWVADWSVTLLIQMPPYRYWRQAWTRSPEALDRSDPEGAVPYLRNRQRDDGLGGWSTPRAKGTSSRQLSLHNRGYE